MAALTGPALGVLEFRSVALGIRAGDAMVKRAPLAGVRAGTVHPGRYLVAVSGAVASVEEALVAGRLTAGQAIVDELFLPAVHPAVLAALRGAPRAGGGEALGVVETTTVAATLQAADAGLKEARVALLELRLADGLGGKSYALFGGAVTDVEAAVDRAVGSLASGELLVERVVVPQLHPEMRDNLDAGAEFAATRGAGG